MKPQRRSRLLAPAGLCLAALFLLGSTWRPSPPPVLWNLSESAPRGVYLRLDQGAPEVGDWVAACLPERLATFGRHRGYLARGSCPGGAAPVIKRLAAAAGAEIELGPEGLLVDGAPQPGSRPFTVDSSGRDLPPTVRYPYRVAPGHVLLLTGVADSWDGRYFGALPEGALLGVYRRIELP